MNNQLPKIIPISRMSMKDIQELSSPNKDPSSKFLLSQFIKHTSKRQPFIESEKVSPTNNDNSNNQYLNISMAKPKTEKLITPKQLLEGVIKPSIRLMLAPVQRSALSSKSSPRASKKRDSYLKNIALEYTAEQVQNKITNIIAQANEDIKEIQITMSVGQLNEKMKKKLKAQMTQNHTYLTKIERLSKNPFLHNDYIYHRMLRSVLNFYEKQMLKAPESVLKDKIDWIETQFYSWLTQLLKWLQKFDIRSTIQLKSEVANVFNWFQNFDKYLEGMKLLQFPSQHLRKKESSEVKEIDRMTTIAVSYNKGPKALDNSTIDQGSKIDAFSYQNQSNEAGFSSPTFKKNKSQFKQKNYINTTTNQDGLIIELQQIGEELKLQETIPQSPKEEQNPHTDKLEFSKERFQPGHYTEIDLSKVMNNRMLPKMMKFPKSSAVNLNVKKKSASRKAESAMGLHKSKDYQDPDAAQDSRDLRSFEILGGTNNKDDHRVISTPISSVSSASNRAGRDQRIGDIDVKKKYLFEAPLSFKMNPPPKIVDLTSDFFEKDTDKETKSRRSVINNPRQNAFMVEQGKKKINQLKQFHGKMISEALMQDFEVMFAPNEEQIQDNNDYYNDPKGLSQGQQFLNQLNQGMMPPALVHDDVLISLQRANQEKFEVKSAGINMIKRTAQDDYRFQQLEEIQNLKKILIQKGLNVNFGVLQRAILMPEDVIFDQGDKNYPTPAFGLIDNPYSKAKKAKKKKKVKKKNNLNRFQQTQQYNDY